MKSCSKCKKSKDRALFNRNARSSDGLGSYCKECANQAGRENYESNKERYFDKAKLMHDERRAKVQAIKESSPCSDCGISYPWYVMDFDHISDDKEADVSYMVRHRYAWHRIEAEIAKCELVCSNCHRTRSYNRWTEKPWSNQFGEGV